MVIKGVIMADYIKSKLSTNPNAEVTVPKEYDIKAKQLIDTIMSLGFDEFREKLPEIVDEHEYLCVPGIMSAASKLLENKDTPHTQVCTDELYLRIVQKGNEKYVSSPSDENELQEAWKVDQELIGEIKKLNR